MIYVSSDTFVVTYHDYIVVIGFYDIFTTLYNKLECGFTTKLIDRFKVLINNNKV